MLAVSLDESHDRQSFDCGDDDLNRWFAQTARQHKAKGVSSTYVAVDDIDATEVLGYYALSPAELVVTDLPPKYQKRLPKKVPVFRLGRLAVAKGQQGKRIGEFLLFDAIERVTKVAGQIGGVGLVVNAKPDAVAYYQQYGFEVMADHPHNLFLTIY